jgi:hypothetical protein
MANSDLRQRCADQDSELPEFLRDFAERYNSAMARGETLAEKVVSRPRFTLSDR